MKAKEICLALAKFKSIYGCCARMFFNDPVKAPEFLREVYEQVENNSDSMEEHLGKSLCNNIRVFCSAEIKKGNLKPIAMYDKKKLYESLYSALKEKTRTDLNGFLN